MTINIINKSSHALPSYETVASAGMDIRANLSGSVILKPSERSLIKPKLCIRVKKGWTKIIDLREQAIHPRSFFRR